jgi:hypothetical protein
MLVSKYKSRFSTPTLLLRDIDPSRVVNPGGKIVSKEKFSRAASKIISPVKEVQFAISVMPTLV